MAKRSTRTTQKRFKATGAARTQLERPSIVHSSVYLPEAVYEALRKVAFDERVKIHDLVMEGIGAALRKRGYPSIESLKAGKKR
jgi:hypothetical protein